MLKKSKLGFSLIELSIVILVIGILVAGVTQGSRIMREAKLKSARSLTTSSPVNSLEGLYYWFDSTSEKSFNANISDNDPIDNWRDINSQTVSNFSLTQTTTNRPLYKSSGINGIPAVLFDGSDDSMSNSNFIFPYSSYSVFIVFQPAVIAEKELLSINDGAGIGGVNIELNDTGAFRVLHRFPFGGTGGDSNYSSNNTYKINTNYIAAYVRNFYLSTATVNLNGINVITNNALTSGSFDGTTRTLTIGNVPSLSRNFSGYIGEIIIFNRPLKNTERQSVEQYLGAKWNVKLS